MELYPIIVEEHEEGGYYAKCPMIQGAWADGETIKEAVANLKNIIKDIIKYRKQANPKVIFNELVQQYEGLAIVV